MVVTVIFEIKVDIYFLEDPIEVSFLQLYFEDWWTQMILYQSILEKGC